MKRYLVELSGFRVEASEIDYAKSGASSDIEKNYIRGLYRLGCKYGDCVTYNNSLFCIVKANNPVDAINRVRSKYSPLNRR